MKPKHLLFYIFSLCLGGALAYYQVFLFVKLSLVSLTSLNLGKIFFSSAGIIFALNAVYRYLLSKYSFSLYGTFSFVSILGISSFYPIWTYYYDALISPSEELENIFIVSIVVQYLGYLLISSLAKHTDEELRVVKRGTWTEAFYLIGSIVCLSVYLIPNTFMDFRDDSLFQISYLSSLVLVALFFILLLIVHDKLHKVYYNGLAIRTLNKKRILFSSSYFLKLMFLGVFMSLTLWISVYEIIPISTKGLSENKEASESFFAVIFMMIYFSQIVFRFLVIPKVESQYSQRVFKLFLPSLIIVMQGLLFAINHYLVNENNLESYFLYYLTAVLNFGLVVSLINSVSLPLLWTYLLPIDVNRRTDYQLNLYSSFSIISLVLAGLIFYYLPHLHSNQEISIKVILGVSVCFWILFVVLSHQEYIKKLKETLEDKYEKRRLKNYKKVLIAPEDQLEQVLNTEQDSKILLNAISMLGILHFKKYKKWVSNYHSHDLWNNEYFQENILFHIKELRLTDYTDVLTKIVESKSFKILRNSQLIQSSLSYLQETEERLETEDDFIVQLSYSLLYKERIIATSLLKHPKIKDKSDDLLFRLMNDNDIRVQKQAISEMYTFDSENHKKNLVAKMSNIKLINTIKSTAVEAGDKIIYFLEDAFKMSIQTEAAQLAIIKAYGEIGTTMAAEKLIDKLASPNPKIASETLSALSKTLFKPNKGQIIQLKATLEEKCSLVIHNLYILTVLEKEQNSSLILIDSMKDEIRYNYSNIYKLLSLLYESNTISLIEKYIWSQDAEESEFALELINITLSDDLKQMLLPILDQRTNDKKIKSLAYVFPVDQLDKHQALRSLLLRDYKDLNRWTRVCVMKELALYNSEKDFDHFNAHLLNDDILLSQTSYLIMQEHEEVFEKELRKRFGFQNKFKEVERQVKEASSFKTSANHSIPLLQFDITSYLKTLKPIADISGLLLLEFAKYQQVITPMAGEIICSHDRAIDMDYYILFEGNASLVFENGEKQIHFGSNELISYWQLIDPFSDIKLIAETECSLYRIEYTHFNNLLADHQEIRTAMLAYDYKNELAHALI